MTAPRYTANEAASLTGAPAETIRTWVRRGLIGRPGDNTLHPAELPAIALRHHLSRLGIEGIAANPLALVAGDPVDATYWARFADGSHAGSHTRPMGALVVVEVDLAAIRADIANRMAKESTDAE